MLPIVIVGVFWMVGVVSSQQGSKQVKCPMKTEQLDISERVIEQDTGFIDDSTYLMRYYFRWYLSEIQRGRSGRFQPLGVAGCGMFIVFYPVRKGGGTGSIEVWRIWNGRAEVIWESDDGEKVIGWLAVCFQQRLHLLVRRGDHSEEIVILLEAKKVRDEEN